MPQDYDVIVIGSGAGGGVAAWRMAQAGKKVLIIERGREITDREKFQNEWHMLIRMEPFERRSINVNGKKNRLFIGAVPGGGTSLYGAVLMRPAKDDFEPGKYYHGNIHESIYQWPISYEDLKPYYEKLEKLFFVSGDKKENIKHVETPDKGYPCQAQKFEPISQKLADSLKSNGYSPFHLPLAIDFEKCLRCPTCPGYLCPNNSRSSVKNRLLNTLIKNKPEVLEGYEAIKLEYGSGHKIKRVIVRNTNNKSIKKLTSDLFIISAGAIGSPVLLQKSELIEKSNQLGRNYMYHAGAVAAGVFYKPTGSADTFTKQVGFTDLYYGTKDFRHKLGYAQALPVPGVMSLVKNSPVPLPEVFAEKMYERTITLAGTVEDLPLQSNRVEVNNNGISLYHKFHKYDIYRSRFFMEKLKKVMYSAGAKLVIGVTGDKDEVHTAHQVGTARFGNDEKYSVLDKNCRMFAYDNLYVLDGSFMPTSLGVGPALTIMANAYRVTDSILGVQ